jgi:hypothetical protein
MRIVNVGVSYRTAPDGVLEKIAVLPGEGIGMLARTVSPSSCNRIRHCSGSRSHGRIARAEPIPAQSTAGSSVGSLADGQGPRPVRNINSLFD